MAHKVKTICKGSEKPEGKRGVFILPSFSVTLGLKALSQLFPTCLNLFILTAALLENAPPQLCSASDLVNTLHLSPLVQCELLMVDGAQREVGSVLSSLFWSVQGSLLSWCYLQLKSTDSGAKDLAADLTDRCKCQYRILENR